MLMHARAVRILEVHGEMIVDVPEPRFGAALPAADPRRLDRMRAQDPVGDVDVVHVLLDDVIAREPGEVQPVADLPFGVASTRVASRRLQRPPWFQKTWPLITSPIAPS